MSTADVTLVGNPYQPTTNRKIFIYSGPLNSVIVKLNYKSVPQGTPKKTRLSKHKSDFIVGHK